MPRPTSINPHYLSAQWNDLHEGQAEIRTLAGLTASRRTSNISRSLWATPHQWSYPHTEATPHPMSYAAPYGLAHTLSSASPYELRHTLSYAAPYELRRTL